MLLTDKASQLRQFKCERFKRIGREFAWISTGQAMATLGSLVGLRVLTGLLSPGTYGELALGMTLGTLALQVVMGPLGNASLRFFSPAREASDLLSFLAALRRLLTKATTMVFGIAASISLVLLLARQFKWMWLGLTAFIFALLSGYNSVLDGMQNAARQRPIVAWHQALASWGRFLVAAGLVLGVGATSSMAMLGYVLATLLVLFSQLWFFRRKFRPTSKAPSAEAGPQKSWEVQMFAYAWPFAAWGILTWAQMVSDRWALQWFASTQHVGLYVALYQIGYYPISIVAGLVVQLVAPIMYQRAGDTSSAMRMEQVFMMNWRLSYMGLGCTALAFLVAALFHDLIFRIFVAPEYASVAGLLPWMVLAGGLFATGQTASLSLLSSLESKTLLLPKVGTAILGISLNCLGAYLYGIPGVVVAGVAFGVVYLIWILILAKQRTSALSIRPSPESRKNWP